MKGRRIRRGREPPSPALEDGSRHREWYVVCFVNSEHDTKQSSGDLMAHTPFASASSGFRTSRRVNNVRNIERWASVATASAVIAYGVSRRNKQGMWLAAAAAAIVLVVGSAGFIAGRADVARYDTAVNALEAVNRATLDISADPQSRRVVLASTDGGSTTGTLLFSPETSKLVVVASDLALPPSGKEYRCWVVVDGQRKNVGKMFFADDLAYWVGDTPEVSRIADGAQFGVSLSDVGRTSLDADPVIAGEL